jgi:hypothetical protein
LSTIPHHLQPNPHKHNTRTRYIRLLLHSMTFRSFIRLSSGKGSCTRRWSRNFHGILCSWNRASWVNVKMFQQDDTFCTVFYSLQTALHVSGETFTHHQELE